MIWVAVRDGLHVLAGSVELTLDAFVDLRLGDRGDERGDSEPEGDPLDEPIPSPIAHLPAPFLRPLPMGTRRENCG